MRSFHRDDPTIPASEALNMPIPSVNTRGLLSEALAGSLVWSFNSPFLLVG